MRKGESVELHLLRTLHGGVSDYPRYSTLLAVERRQFNVNSQTASVIANIRSDG
ncbi:hypothetical protein M378DRAFT_168800 [Amanita muscaria Koide BX008]|uniref:Uncharacterized protein n=1 Tax=Amanita muscaria (strain Koide BX008) TaxID=946122 RepID=A0A0C2T056_AMAMK|nr:hypothetical protein M378DRAFT_168800 [Amanita muscaria Koide BX008]